MGIKLTDGAISAMMNGDNLDKPVLQMLSYKKMPGSAGSASRFRLVLSDGVHFVTSAMLGTQLNHHIETGALDKNAVITLDNYVINCMTPENNSRKIIIILALTISVPGDSMGMTLGNPTVLQDAGSSSNAPAAVPSSTAATSAIKGEPQQSIYRPSTTNYNNNSVPGSSSFIKQEHSESGERVIHPIESLTPYQNRWTIRVKLTNKSNVRTWSNSRGEGKLFSMDFTDESGEIRATAFKDDCDKFFNILEPGKVYYVSNAHVKMANKKFSSANNDYELSFGSETTVELCNEKMDNLPAQHFNFVTIDHLERIEKDTFVDLIGVCKRVGDVQSFTSRSTNRELKKRELHVVDQSKKEVSLTLWADEAENFCANDGAVIAVKGARVSDFGGRSLNSSGLLLINPDVPETKLLRSWYEREGQRTESQSISNQGFSGGGGSASWKSLAEASAANMRADFTSDYFSVKAYPVFFRKENSMYKSCANADCKKKVVDQGNGMYRCEKCQKDSPDFKWRLLLSFNIADSSDHMWVTSFQESGEMVLGKTCDELAQIKERSEEEFHAIFNAAIFECFIFKLRTKMETYHDESRLKTSVVSVTPVDYPAYCKKMIDDLTKWLS